MSDRALMVVAALGAVGFWIAFIWFIVIPFFEGLAQ